MLELDGTLIVAIISFIIFAFIMNAVLYQPIIKILEEREAFLAENASIEKSANEEAENILEQKNQELSEARANATKEVSLNSEQFKKEQRQNTETFSKEQKEKTEQEKQEILQLAQTARQELIVNTEELSDLIYEKILGERNV